MTAEIVDGPNTDDEDDLTPAEKLKLAAYLQILRTGKLHLRTEDLDVLIDYPDR